MLVVVFGGGLYMVGAIAMVSVGMVVPYCVVVQCTVVIGAMVWTVKSIEVESIDTVYRRNVVNIG